MFKRRLLARFNIYLSLFAILLVTICPVITQTVALLGESTPDTPHYPAALNHFECASQFYKENKLNPADFLDVSSLPASPIKALNTDITTDDSIVICGYCDLLHTASINLIFYIALFEIPNTELIITCSDPYLSSLNYWSTLSRAPPFLKNIS